MLIHNKAGFEPGSAEIDIQLTTSFLDEAAVRGDMHEGNKQLWDVIVRMHYLAQELRDPGFDWGVVSPEYTRLVANLLTEWAVMAEEAVSAGNHATNASVPELGAEAQVGRH